FTEMGKGAEPAVPLLLVYFDFKGEKEPPLYNDLIDTLGKIGKPARNHLTKGLAHKNPWVRLASVKALEKTQPTGADAKKLIATLNGRLSVEPFQQIRTEITQAVERLRLAVK